MKVIRILLTIIFFLPSYPILFATYSLMGIGLMIGFITGMQIIFAWPTGNQQWIEECMEGWEIFLVPFWIPFKLWWDYIQKGTFKME